MNELQKLIAQIDNAIAEEDWDGNEMVEPSSELVKQAKALLTEADNIPQGGFVSWVGEGDIRIEWRRKERELSLVFLPSKQYLWHTDGTSHGSCAVSVETLNQWFKWLREGCLWP